MIDSTLLLTFAAAFAATYLLGSVNFALVVSKLLYRDDIRKYGSGNAGMTNILRVYGKFPAFLTGLGDFLKGVIAVIIGRMLFERIGVTLFDGAYIGAIGVLLGHLFPIFFGFKGGKGVLTICGALMLMSPIQFCILFVIFVPMAFITRIVSLASVLGTLTYPILTYYVGKASGEPYMLNMCFGLICVAIILYMHRENIKRLLNGTEKRLGSDKKKS